MPPPSSSKLTSLLSTRRMPTVLPSRRASVVSSASSASSSGDMDKEAKKAAKKLAKEAKKAQKVSKKRNGDFKSPKEKPSSERRATLLGCCCP